MQIKLSKCGNLLAFTVAEAGHDDLHRAFVRDLRTGKMSEQVALQNVVSVEWAADGATLLATQPDELGRPFRVVRYPLHSNTVHVVLKESDARFFLELQRTKDWQYLAINANSKTSSEIHLLRADAPGAALRCIQQRQPGLEYFFEHWAHRLLIMSNARGADNYALYAVGVDEQDLGVDNWKVVLPGSACTALEDLDVFESAVVVHERNISAGGLPQIRVIPRHLLLDDDTTSTISEQSFHVPLSSAPVFSVSAGANADFWSKSMRLQLSSPIQMERAVEYTFETNTVTAAAVLNPSTFNSDAEFVCERRWAPISQQKSHFSTSIDDDDDDATTTTITNTAATTTSGQGIPITLIYSRDNMGKFRLDTADNNCLVVAYGCYGHNLPTDFLPERIPLLRRGWVVALVHVRGGGELGRAWHAAG